MPKCRFCDRKNPEGVRRCEKCGAPLDDRVAPPQPESTLEAEAPVPSPAPGSLEDTIIR
jgi:hypothetical protein